MAETTNKSRSPDQVRASFAQNGEIWLTNALIHPQEEHNTRESRETDLIRMYRLFDLRFDYDHLVDGNTGEVLDGKTCAQRFDGLDDGERFAVYGKSKH